MSEKISSGTNKNIYICLAYTEDTLWFDIEYGINFTFITVLFKKMPNHE